MLDHLDIMSIFAGTHNEQSTYDLMTMMKEKSIAANDNRIWFYTLYGMSDKHYNLATNGYNVAKYLPFGPVKT
jgi:proline dehydrogenase